VALSRTTSGRGHSLLDTSGPSDYNHLSVM
jgi:hypothetical protein